MSAEMLRCEALDVAIGPLLLVKALDVAVGAGEFVCIIGCNGAGKTSLLHTLAGLRGSHDRIAVLGTALTRWSRRALARELALLLQHHDDAFPMTVLDAVLAARHPHQGLLSGETVADREIAAKVLGSLALDGFAKRDLASLSGGERQRVGIAATLAQQPRIALLDEPLNNLDPRHQLEVMRRLDTERARGAAIVAVLHDVNLVARFADRVLLLFGPAHDGAWLCDDSAAALTTDNLTRLYDTPVHRAQVDGQLFFYTR